MSTFLGFELMPALNEGDEHVSLADILALRDACLTEVELWALCRECCLAIQSVHNSCEMFQTLCITPESLAFDAEGAVCFLDLPADPEVLYIPPEYETVGNSIKAHLYSLGMTMLYAAEYNVGNQADKLPLSSDLRQMIGQMTMDEYEERVSLERVVEMCVEHLENVASNKICYELASVGRLETSTEEDMLSMASIGSLQSLTSLGQGDIPLMRTARTASPRAEKSTPTLILGAEGSVGDECVDPTNKLWLTDSEIQKITASFTDREIRSLACNVSLLNELGNQCHLSKNAFLKKVLMITSDQNSGRSREVLSGYESLEKFEQSSEIDGECSPGHPAFEASPDDVNTDLDPGDIHAKPYEDRAENNEDGSASVLTEQEPGVSSDVNWEPIGKGTGVSEPVIGSGPSSWSVEGSGASLGSSRLLHHRMGTWQRDSGSQSPPPSPAEASPCRDGPALSLAVGAVRDGSPHKATVTYDSVFGQRDSKVHASPEEEESSLFPLFPTDPIQNCDLNGFHPNRGVLPARQCGGGVPGNNEDPVTDPNMASRGKAEREPARENRRDLTKSPWTTKMLPAPSSQQGQYILEILDKLECGLHENELWSLCRESVLALHKYRDELPAYISLETVVVEDTGQISFHSVPEDRELEVVYLAPELQQHGVVTQKTCLFGIAAMLWSAADYKLPPNQEPALSEELESLLISMTQDGIEARPGVPQVLQACNGFEHRQEISSTLVCKSLAAEAKKAQEFGKSNKMVRHILDTETAQVAADQHSQLMNSIKDFQVQAALKPVSERQLGERHLVLTLHDKLMAEICLPHRKLRKSSKPKVQPVAEIFLNSPELMAGLMRVTGKQRQVSAYHRARSPRHVPQKTDMPSSSAFSTLPKRTANLVKVGTATGTLPRNTMGPGAQNVTATSTPNQPEKVPRRRVRTRPQNEPAPVTRNASPSPSRVPNAFTSTATHFKPIVLTVNTATGIKEKEKIKPVNDTPVGDKDRKVAMKLQELKKNIMRNRLPLSLAQDIENEPHQDANLVKVAVNHPERKPASVTPTTSVPAPLVNSVTSTVGVSSTNGAPTSPNGPFMTQSQGQVYHHAPPTAPESHTSPEVTTFQTPMQPLDPFSQGYSPYAQSQGAFPQTHSAFPQSQTGLSHAQGPFPHAQGIFPQAHGLYGGHPAVHPGMNIASSMSQSPYSYSMPPHPSGGPMYPMQMQMQYQQDPRSGLFHLMPVMMPGMMTHTPSTLSPVSGITSPSVHSPPIQSPPIQSPPVQSPPVRSPPVDSASSPSQTSQDAPNTSMSSTEDPSEMRLSRQSSDRIQGENGQTKTSRYVKHNSKERDRYREMKMRSKSESASVDRDRDREKRLDDTGRRRREKSREREDEVISIPPAQSVCLADERGESRARSQSRSEGVRERRYQYRTHNTGAVEHEEENFNSASRERSRAGRPVQRTKSNASRSHSHHQEVHHEYQRQSRMKKASSEELLDKIESKDDTRVAPWRQKEERRTRLKRAKSGSSIDYRNLSLEVKTREIPVDDSQLNYNSRSLSRSRKHKSQPNLEVELSPMETPRSRQIQHPSGPRSPLRSPLNDGQSPPPSPSLSKDSGVSGLNLRNGNGSGEISLMERLLSSDTIRHQQKLSKVIRLLRDEFAFDGYMENGIEDLAMARGLHSNESSGTHNSSESLETMPYMGTHASTSYNTPIYQSYEIGQHFKQIQTNPCVESHGLYVQPNCGDNFAHPIGGGFYYDPVDGNIYMDPALVPYSEFEQNPEYVLSLGNLKWDTFNNAITEKYCDLYWQDDLLLGLYESVNGRPATGEKIQNDTANVVHQQMVAPPHSPGQGGPQESYQRDERVTRHMNGHVDANRQPESNRPLVRDTYDNSAFRPIRTQTDHRRGLSDGAPIYKPKPMKVPDYTNETSDSTESESEERRWRYKKKQHIEKVKSNSMHNLLRDSHEQVLDINANGLSKSCSQGTISVFLGPVDIETEDEPSPDLPSPSSPVSPVSPVQIETPKPKVIHVRSSESENDCVEANTHVNGTKRFSRPMKFTPAQRAKSQSSGYLYRYDSDSSSASDMRQAPGLSVHKPMGHFERQNVLRLAQRSTSRDESISSRSSSQCSNRRLNGARSESYLHMLSDGSESDTSRGKQPSFASVSSTCRLHRGCVAYYSADLEERILPEIRDFARQVDIRTKESIEIKMAELDQQMMMEHRMKKKTLKFYQKLMEGSKLGRASGEQKSMLAKMSKQIGEMNDKLEFLDAAKKHLEMLYAEHWGLDHSLLYALTMCPGDQPMLLAPCDNPCLQYQVLKVPEGQKQRNNHDGYILQAGTPEGLMAYLFAQEALSDGFIHQFFFCYRYFSTPRDLFNFLCDKFAAGALSLSPDAQVPMKVKARAIDLFQVWIEGYYTLDFRHNLDLARELFTFVKDKIIPTDASAEQLLDLLEDCQDGRHVDLFYPQFNLTEDVEVELLHAQQQAPRKWESFKAALHLSAKPMKIKQPVRSKVSSCVDKRGRMTFESEAYYPKVGGRRSDAFTLADYTAQNLAEQLTMMEQELFRQTHPVHFLNSKAQGIGVDLANPILNKAHSTQRLNTAWEDNQDQSLFAGDFTVEDAIQCMIEYSQTLSFWIAGEIVSCVSSKMQVGVLSKFIYTAKMCHELRNYATCVSVIDALENVIVRQVPAWRSLPSKCIAMMEELSAIKVFLKADSMCLSANKDGLRLPTIPCVLLFLLHVQQLEIGGFTLANGMFKWAKMKAIAKVIDQIRVFKEQSYAFEIDHELQDALRQRMNELAQQDLHVLAAQHDTNFTKIASPGLFQGALRRMRGKWAGKADL